MNKIILFTIFLILTVANLYGNISMKDRNHKNDPLSTNHEINRINPGKEQEIELIIPEGISKNNLDQVFGSCINCVEIERSVSKNDATELKNLPNMVKNTIDEIAKYKKGKYDDFHNIIAKLSKGDINNNFTSALRPGERICQLFYFSFMDNSVELVGTHRCLVDRLIVEPFIFKFTGVRLFATLMPYKESAMAFIGRSYDLEHQQQRYDIENPDNIENDNFGNEVGYVFSIGKKLVLLSISQRGFTRPDRTFFSCLIIK